MDEAQHVGKGKNNCFKNYIMPVWRKIVPFGRKNVVHPFPAQHQPRKSNRRPAEQTFEILSAYLWFHGIGFTRGMDFKGRGALTRTLASIACVILWEGNFLYVICILSASIYNQGFRETRSLIAIVLNLIMNIFTRVLFYTHRGQLRRTVQKLDNLVDRVVDAARCLKNFDAKLVVALLLNDSMYWSYVFWIFRKNSTHVFEQYNFLPLSVPCAEWLYSASYALSYHSRCMAATTAYFCMLCHVLKGTLRQFTRNLLAKTTYRDFLEVYGDIEESLLAVDKLMHPFLATAFVYFMSMEFQKTYEVLLFESTLARFNLLFALVMFFNLLLICANGSSVVNAALEVRNAARKLLPSGFVPDSKHVQILVRNDRGFRGFKILDSIVIDMSLIAASTGVLLTYGVLLATFNISTIGD